MRSVTSPMAQMDGTCAAKNKERKNETVRPGHGLRGAAGYEAQAAPASHLRSTTAGRWRWAALLHAAPCRSRQPTRCHWRDRTLPTCAARSPAHNASEAGILAAMVQLFLGLTLVWLYSSTLTARVFSSRATPASCAVKTWQRQQRQGHAGCGVEYKDMFSRPEPCPRPPERGHGGQNIPCAAAVPAGRCTHAAMQM